ncbi:outer membrane beta-barrel protein [Hymenobacter sp. UYCo722]|uniref:outer membrane beta-barrel protein n=1 Tax=Hymenobacter sp. UYCo722 TaxID=3156335 RepID=UPI003393B48D
MWSDKDIDNAFHRLDPAEPEPTPFPLDAWLKLEAGLDQAVIDRAVRHRLRQFFAAELAVVALAGLGWSLWPTAVPAPTISKARIVDYATSPGGNTTVTRRRASAGASVAIAPAPRPNTGRAATGLTPPATPLPATATAPTAAPAVAGAVVFVVPPVRGAVGRERPSFLGVVSASGRYPNRVTRFHSADGRITAPGNSIARSGGPITRHSLSSSMARVARYHPEARSLADAASAAEAGAYPEKGSSTDAASRIATTSKPATAAVTTSLDEAAIARAAPSSLAAVSSLAPVATFAAEPTRPAAETIPVALALNEVAPTSLPAVVRQQRFYVGLVAAPDVSTVKFADVQAPHLNVGLTLEYRLGQRWRVATGLQRATKEYYARREDYDWTSYPRAYTRDFSWVDGTCTVVDIPLNLRYDAVVGPRYRIFGTAGLSSFFMQRERYTYDYYDNTSNAPAVWDRSFVNDNQHWFKVLNVSAGYEYGLGTHWRLQAEPYVKVPLAGVGAGKVKLLSAGVFFGLKYGF